MVEIFMFEWFFKIIFTQFLVPQMRIQITFFLFSDKNLKFKNNDIFGLMKESQKGYGSMNEIQGSGVIGHRDDTMGWWRSPKRIWGNERDPRVRGHRVDPRIDEGVQKRIFLEKLKFFKMLFGGNTVFFSQIWSCFHE